MIPPEELRISQYPPPNRGGQHAGVIYGVEVEHIPTGLLARVVSDRSMHRNKAVAIRMIEAALTDPEFRG